MTKTKAPAAAFRLVVFHQGDSFYWGGPGEVALLEPEFTLSDTTGLEPLVPRSAEPLVFACSSPSCWTKVWPQAYPLGRLLPVFVRFAADGR